MTDTEFHAKRLYEAAVNTLKAAGFSVQEINSVIAARKSKREEFASRALAGLLAKAVTAPRPAAEYAALAVGAADALIAELNKEQKS